MTCHQYHAFGQALTVDAHGVAPASLKQMLLGQK
jgi:hypothetical protein